MIIFYALVGLLLAKIVVLILRYRLRMKMWRAGMRPPF